MLSFYETAREKQTKFETIYYALDVLGAAGIQGTDRVFDRLARRWSLDLWETAMPAAALILIVRAGYAESIPIDSLPPGQTIRTSRSEELWFNAGGMPLPETLTLPGPDGPFWLGENDTFYRLKGDFRRFFKNEN